MPFIGGAVGKCLSSGRIKMKMSPNWKIVEDCCRPSGGRQHESKIGPYSSLLLFAHRTCSTPTDMDLEIILEELEVKQLELKPWLGIWSSGTSSKEQLKLLDLLQV